MTQCEIVNCSTPDNAVSVVESKIDTDDVRRIWRYYLCNNHLQDYHKGIITPSGTKFIGTMSVEEVLAQP